MQRTLDLARSLQCSGAWVLTDETNFAARALYSTAGGRETQGVVMYEFNLGPAGSSGSNDSSEQPP